MTMLKSVSILILIFVTCPTSFAEQATCSQIFKLADEEQVVLSPAVSLKVVGKGRLYFYTSPHENCMSKDVFVVPGDNLIAYAEYKGWSSVMYINPKTGKDYEGWVQSKRLKLIGTIGPNY